MKKITNEQAKRRGGSGGGCLIVLLSLLVIFIMASCDMQNVNAEPPPPMKDAPTLCPLCESRLMVDNRRYSAGRYETAIYRFIYDCGTNETYKSGSHRIQQGKICTEREMQAIGAGQIGGE